MTWLIRLHGRRWPAFEAKGSYFFTFSSFLELERVGSRLMSLKFKKNG